MSNSRFLQMPNFESNTFMDYFMQKWAEYDVKTMVTQLTYQKWINRALYEHVSQIWKLLVLDILQSSNKMLLFSL